MTEPPDAMPPIDDDGCEDEDQRVGLRSLSVGHETLEGSEEGKVKRRGRARKKQGKVRAISNFALILAQY